MNIYLVDREDVDYDETATAVVVAANVAGAREVAKSTRGDQSPDVWDSAKVERLGVALKKYTEPAVIHADFNAG